MTETGKRANNATISDLGKKNATANWNLSPKELASISIEKGQATLTSTRMFSELLICFIFIIFIIVYYFIY